MSLIVVDVESDGPSPGHYSMVSFGAVVVDRALATTFKGEVRPVSDRWLPEALAVSGVTREEHLGYPEPAGVMAEFAEWVVASSKGRPVFCSDNVAFDWMFVNWYFYETIGHNPFGWSGRRIGDLYCGMVKDGYAGWKHLRRTPHTHDPVDDAKGNAEAILAMVDMGLRLPVG